MDSSSSGPRSISDPEVRNLITQNTSDQKRYHPSPLAWEDQVLYFLLPDRFSTGDEDGSLDNNGQPTLGSVKPFTSTDNENAIPTASEASVWRDAGFTWQGGTLKGIQSKLGYLKRLGATALWIGPIFKQVPRDEHLYHGYAVQNFLDIDPHFGTRDDLRDLVSAAHELDIYVILDIILNHSGNVFEYKGGEKQWSGRRYEVEGFRDAAGKPTLPFRPIRDTDDIEDPESCAIWPVELQDPSAFTCEGSISNWDYDPEFIRGDFLSLKDINLGSGHVDSFVPSGALEILCQAYKYWIAYADLDGYRIDTVKHMGDGPTRYLCTTLHEYAATLSKENFFLVGEVTGNRAYDVVQVTGLDAALGVGGVQENLWRACKGDVQPAAYFDLFRNATFLKRGSNAWMRNKLVTMIDDHDQVWRGGNKARFGFDDVGQKLLVPAIALNLTTLGIPCIYYGTEQQFDGRGDSDRYIREAMFGGAFGAFRSKERHFFGESKAVFEQVARICEVRKRYLALRRGRQYLREISANGVDFGFPQKLNGRMLSIIAWSRILADQEILCAINTDVENWTQAYVTIDSGLHKDGNGLKCIYSSGQQKDAPAETLGILDANRKAVLLRVPPAGFVMYG
ncbi:glycoside hydrolase family 13 protein [Lentithecium fluviatile CBS 122367]|uniref:Glycoside hydrolase family 13 protein n=1 Tax=Lentithecium fluviatile CBS 122367 TaxID=1168545 RepID=A0A6G1J067_9PLEO|nr:glycoside hydrolase family 13 protein [Lentithecium fluviatile CBS 122367]